MDAPEKRGAKMIKHSQKLFKHTEIHSASHKF